ncbi:unnamed protein product [Tilletia laevis]|nr:unnamed protein product [Tilletia laevis]
MAGHDESPIKPARFRPAAGRGRGAVHDPTSDAPGLESRFGDWEPAGDEEDTYGEEDDELDDYLENGEDSEEEEDNDKVDELTELVERLAKDTVKLTKSDLTELAKAIAYCFYSEHVTKYSAKGPLFGRVMAFLKANPRAVSDDFKEHFDNAEVRRKEVQPAIHASMGIDSGTKKMTLYELWSYLCKGYGVPFTKQRAYRIALMRFVASEKPVRHKDGRPTGKFWRTLDATIADMQQRQGEDAAGVKEDLQNIYEADMETYGTRDDVEFSKGGSKEDALKTAMTARSD